MDTMPTPHVSPLPGKNALLNINGQVFRVTNVSEKRGYIGLHYLGPAKQPRRPALLKKTEAAA